MKNTLIGVLLLFATAGSVGLLLVTEKAGKLKEETRVARARVDSARRSSESLQGDLKLAKQKSEEQIQQLEKSESLVKTKLVVSRMEIEKKDKALVEVSKKCDESLAQQKVLTGQLTDLKKANEQLQADSKNSALKLATLQNLNTQLTDDLAAAKLISKDNILIESLAANGKPYAKGRKVRKIITEFSIKKDLKNPTFRIFGPDGRELSSVCGNFSLERIAEGGTAAMKPKKIRLTYASTNKMSKGLYEIEILNNNEHMGNLMVMFR